MRGQRRVEIGDFVDIHNSGFFEHLKHPLTSLRHKNQTPAQRSSPEDIEARAKHDLAVKCAHVFDQAWLLESALQGSGCDLFEVSVDHFTSSIEFVMSTLVGAEEADRILSELGYV